MDILFLISLRKNHRVEETFDQYENSYDTRLSLLPQNFNYSTILTIPIHGLCSENSHQYNLFSFSYFENSLFVKICFKLLVSTTSIFFHQNKSLRIKLTTFAYDLCTSYTKMYEINNTDEK